MVWDMFFDTALKTTLFLLLPLAIAMEVMSYISPWQLCQDACVNMHGVVASVRCIQPTEMYDEIDYTGIML